MSALLNFKNDFTNAVEILENAKKEYRQKKYEETLTSLESSLSHIKLTSPHLFSNFLSLIGKILWKLSQLPLATDLWKRALSYDPANREAFLCLKLLTDTQNIYYFSIFLNITLDKYYSGCDVREEEIDNDALLSILIDYWNENLNIIDFEQMDETEIIDLFLQINAI